VDWVKPAGNKAYGWFHSLALRALAVFAKEFPDDFTLIDHPNMTPIPHLGAAAKEG
jgi:phosphoglycerate dehydrogenase-like enzyme